MTTYHEPRCSGSKECTKCKKTLPVIAFSARGESPDGLAYYCRDCEREYTRHTASNIARKEKRIEKRRDKSDSMYFFPTKDY